MMKVGGGEGWKGSVGGGGGWWEVLMVWGGAD